MTVFPALPVPVQRLARDEEWTYSNSGGPSGVCVVNAWQTSSGYLAIVTETGRGLSITNGAAAIRRLLTGWLPPGELVVIEHWPAGTGAGFYEHWDQVTMAGDQPRWRRIWPVTTAHPGYAVYRWWVTRYGTKLGITTGDTR